MMFVGPIKLNSLAKNGIPRVSRGQNKRISKWENLTFWPKFPDVLVKKSVYVLTLTGHTSAMEQDFSIP